jgi:hypothetical protein
MVGMSSGPVNELSFRSEIILKTSSSMRVIQFRFRVEFKLDLSKIEDGGLDN